MQSSMSCITFKKVFEEVRSYGFQVECFLPLYKAASNQQLTGIALPDQAGNGDVAWVSKSQMETFDSEKFQGSLLICETDKDLRLNKAAVIVTSKPKLLFAKVVNSLFKSLTQIKWPSSGTIHRDAKVHQSVNLAKGVIIGQKVVLKKNVTVAPNTVLANCEVEEGSVIGANCTIGLPGFGFVKDTDGAYVEFPQIGGVLIGKNVRIGSNTCIDRGAIGNTIIMDGVKIDNLVHVAHNVSIGKNTLVIANSMIGGSTAIGENAWVAPSVSLLNKLRIGNDSVIGMGAVVIRDVEDYSVVVGNPGKVIKKTN